MPTTDEFEEHRSALFGLAYRMLGNVADAENIVQDAYIRWQNTPVADIQSARAYLMKITSRLCIDHLRMAYIQREEYVGAWLPEPLLQTIGRDPEGQVETYEAISMALLVLLETLSPIDRAVFLLHEVFSYTYPEIAPIVGRTPADCRQIGHRARERILKKRPRFDVETNELETVVQQFLNACHEGNISDLLTLLSPDVNLTIDSGGKVSISVAGNNILTGADKITQLYIDVFKKQASIVTFQIRTINGQPALLACEDGRPVGVTSFDITDGKIHAIYQMRNPDKLMHLKC